jgi:hypothetical protein
MTKALPKRIKILRSPNTENKLNNLNRERVVVKTDPVQPTTIVKDAAPEVAKTLTTASYASAAVIIRYFVIVDILINALGKINVELGPRVADLVT